MFYSVQIILLVALLRLSKVKLSTTNLFPHVRECNLKVILIFRFFVQHVRIILPGIEHMSVYCVLSYQQYKKILSMKNHIILFLLLFIIGSNVFAQEKINQETIRGAQRNVCAINIIIFFGSILPYVE